MQHLIEHQIRVGEVGARDVGALGRDGGGGEHLFEGREVVPLGCALVFGVGGVFGGAEEGLDEEGAPWEGGC